MENFKTKLIQLREEAQAHIARADAAEQLKKKIIDENIHKGHEMLSLQVKLERVEKALDKAEQKMRENKETLDQGEVRKTEGEENAKKVADLETELDTVSRSLREATEKVREMDIKTEQYERRVHKLENECKVFETKAQDLTKEYDAIKSEMDQTIENLAVL
ncbi:hypothetical protein EMPS_05057 [Entomortierella parvispora]|uniref:Tropomyosin n=1 Tax=Entomortierella parvispora TaxID=205924 RepID=A0A9P3LW56_9FUNG|nr:hypothetical protein EMPS_05057 [Entomortierella parvispora]